MKTSCPNCGNKYQKLGAHWNWNPDCRPKITQKQKSIVNGLLLGDGSTNKGNKNHSITIGCKEKKYLDYLHDSMGCISSGVKKQDSSNYAELNGEFYVWRSVSHPYFNNLSELWYNNDGKSLPKGLSLNPTTLKHWYAGDGTLHKQGQVRIATTEFQTNRKQIEYLFEDIGIGIAGWHDSCFRFNADESREILKYMGDPLFGYEYKWDI